MDHMRKFGEHRTIDAGDVEATNGDIYGMKRKTTRDLAN